LDITIFNLGNKGVELSSGIFESAKDRPFVNQRSNSLRQSTLYFINFRWGSLQHKVTGGLHDTSANIKSRRIWIFGSPGCLFLCCTAKKAGDVIDALVYTLFKELMSRGMVEICSIHCCSC
jgi:hypothetical protein